MALSRPVVSEGSSDPGATRGTPATAPPTDQPVVHAVRGIATLAVLAVIAGHAGWDGLPGGGLAVEILFVAAGYAVTATLLAEVDRTGRVALSGFYGRMLRTIGPALITVVGLVCVASLLFAADDTVGALKGEAAAAVLGVSNWYAAVTAMPMGLASGSLTQHLWAVAVLVHVIVVWPVIVVGCARLGGRRRVRRVARTVAIGSAVLMLVLAMVWDVPGSEATARVAFGTDTRLVGLMTGAALATLRVPPEVSDYSRHQRRTWDVLGCVALAGAVIVVSRLEEFSGTAFRGGIALTAILGGLIVAAVTVPGSSLARAVLAVPGMRWLGLRVYPLYLWHWPVLIVAARLPFPDWAAGVGSVAATVVLADLTYRHVERPIRDGTVAAAITRARWEDGPAATMVRRRLAVVTAVGAAVLALVVTGMVTTPSAALSGTATAQGSGESAQVSDDGAAAHAPAVDCAVAKCVALTFDDGPGPHTERLLGVLDRLDVSVTFFMLGEQAKRYPDVARLVAQSGHEIGTHTYDHDDLSTLDPAEAAEEITAGVAAVTAATGTTPTLFRPPYGHSNEAIREVQKDLGLTEIRWDVDTSDWRDRDAATAATTAFAGIEPGSIVLLHDTRPTTVDAVAPIVFVLRSAGYTIVPVGTLLDGMVEPGRVYSSRPASAPPSPTETPNATPTGQP